MDRKGEWKNKIRISARSQSGRQTKKPDFGRFIRDLCGLDILADDLRRVIKTLYAPSHWEEHLPFMVVCLSVRYPFPDEKAGLRFADLFAQEPGIFLEVMTEINRILDEKIESKEFKVAALHCMVPELWMVKSTAITDALSTALHCRVSAKTVEHARALAAC